jgi:hypothetical protein
MQSLSGDVRVIERKIANVVFIERCQKYQSLGDSDQGQVEKEMILTVHPEQLSYYMHLVTLYKDSILLFF